MILSYSPPLSPLPMRSHLSASLCSHALPSPVVVTWGFTELLRTKVSNRSFTLPKPSVLTLRVSLIPPLSPKLTRSRQPVSFRSRVASSPVVFSRECVELVRTMLSPPSRNPPEPTVMDLLKPPPEPPDSSISLPCSRNRHLLQPPNPPFLSHPPPPTFLPPSSTIASVNTDLVHGNGILHDYKPKSFNLRIYGPLLIHWAWPILLWPISSTIQQPINSRSRFIFLLCFSSGRQLVSSLFLVKSTGSSTGLSDFSELGYRVLPTYGVSLTLHLRLWITAHLPAYLQSRSSPLWRQSSNAQP